MAYSLPLVQQVLSVLLAQCGELGTQEHELNRVEEVTLPTPIPAHDHIVLRAKRLDLILAPETAEARDEHLLDVHCMCVS
jgi:hypothetical protein